MVCAASSVFRQGAIECRSRVTSGYVPTQKPFDLVVVASSWDERALVITTAPVDAHTVVLVTFENRGKSGRREHHDVAILDWATLNASAVERVHGSSEDVRAMWRDLRGVIDARRAATDRPLRVLFDLSTCPRYLALAALQACIGSGVADEVVFTYAEAQYPTEARRNDRYELFTAGRWETLAVPGLVGRYDPALQSHYIVAVGFEGSKTRRVVTRADPDHLTALFPDPAVAPDYVERTMSNNSPMFKEWGIGSEDLVRAGAGDVVGAWRALANSSHLDAAANYFLLCAGTKPHALAMGLMALASGDPTVLYVKPAAHKEVHIRPSGTYWTYTVRDMVIAPPTPDGSKPATSVSNGG
jgi:hypothetical protein